MPTSMWCVSLGLGLALAGAGGALGAADQTVIASIDLKAPFASRSDWRFVATQGPAVEGVTGEQEPGQVALCLARAPGAACDPSLQTSLVGASSDLFNLPHYVDKAEIVRGSSGAPLFLVQTSSEHSGDGDQLVLTQVLAYSPAKDSFQRVFEKSVGHNNDQEVRFVAAGPLKGDIISAEPTANAPFGFWVMVNTEAPGQAYRQVLRYRSATHYGDGNPLAVIDSEMPNIESKLGLWKSGQPLPVPAGPCPKPHLVKTELWCS